MKSNQEIIVDIIKQFRVQAVTQAMLASKLGIAASQLAKAKNGTATPGTTLDIRKKMEELWAECQNGEAISPTSTRPGQMLWQAIQALPLKKIILGLILLGLLCLPFFILNFCGWTLQKASEVSGIKIQSSDHGIMTYLSLNLFASALFSAISLFTPVIQSNIDQKVKSSAKDFSLSWSLFWLSWFFLYLLLNVAYLGFIDLLDISSYENNFHLEVSVTWAIADILNLLNTAILLHIFLNMYLKKYDRALWYLALPLFIGIAWVAVFDRFFEFKKPFDEIGATLVSYASGIVVLLFIGRLNSLFIKVPFKLLFLVYFNFYALAQMNWGGDMSTEYLLIFLFAKIFLWAYVFEAFFRHRGKLEEYFTFVNREQETNT